MSFLIGMIIGLISAILRVTIQVGLKVLGWAIQLIVWIFKQIWKFVCWLWNEIQYKIEQNKFEKYVRACEEKQCEEIFDGFKEIIC